MLTTGIIVFGNMSNGREISVKYIGTDMNVADFFTKALVGDKFKCFRSIICIRDLPRTGGGG